MTQPTDEQKDQAMSPNDKHILRLIQIGESAQGRAKVSAMLLPIVEKLPDELVIISTEGGEHFASLTDASRAILKYL